VTLFDGEVEPARQPRSTAPVGVVERDHTAIRDWLSEYLDGSLPESDRSTVEDHLRGCGSCRAYEATLDATRRAVQALPREQASASAKQRLLEIVDQPAANPGSLHPAE
jgi:anti-sigma factor RsiW